MVSVIVPVYNAGQTLPRCLESIRQQTYRDFEVILVNDGSTDNSLSICQYYVKIDPRFRVFTQQNGGEAMARNAGMEQVRFPYICFVDADDYVASTYIADLYSAAQTSSADLVVQGKCLQHGKSHQIRTFSHTQCFSLPDQSEQCFNQFDVVEHGTVWSKLFRADLIRSHKLHFSSDVKLAVDMCFVLDYLKYSKLLVLSPSVDYYYLANPVSLSTCYWDYCTERRSHLHLQQSWQELLQCVTSSGLKRQYSSFLGYYINRLVITNLFHPSNRLMMKLNDKELKSVFLPQMRNEHRPTTTYTWFLKFFAVNRIYIFYRFIFRLAVWRYHLPVNFV